MGFDGFLVPDWAKPYVGWVVGMDWPEGDESGCFRLADACVTAAYRVVEGADAHLPESARLIGADWDGDAHLAFAAYVRKTADEKVATLVERLVNAAVSINAVGVQIQWAKYMIEATVWLLIAQLAVLIKAAVVNKAALLLIPVRVRIARMTVMQIARTCLRNIAIYAAIVGGMEAGVQALQIKQGRRDEFDLKQIGISAASGGVMGMLMGGLSGGLSRLATPGLRAGLTKAEMSAAEKLIAAAHSSLYGQAAQYAVTGGLTTAGTMLAQGNFSWEMLAKGITSSALGADGQHLVTSPHGGGPGGQGGPMPGTSLASAPDPRPSGPHEPGSQPSGPQGASHQAGSAQAGSAQTGTQQPAGTPPAPRRETTLQAAHPDGAGQAARAEGAGQAARAEGAGQTRGPLRPPRTVEIGSLGETAVHDVKVPRDVKAAAQTMADGVTGATRRERAAIRDWLERVLADGDRDAWTERLAKGHALSVGSKALYLKLRPEDFRHVENPDVTPEKPVAFGGDGVEGKSVRSASQEVNGGAVRNLSESPDAAEESTALPRAGLIDSSRTTHTSALEVMSGHKVISPRHDYFAADIAIDVYRDGTKLTGAGKIPELSVTLPFPEQFTREGPAGPSDHPPARPRHEVPPGAAGKFRDHGITVSGLDMTPLVQEVQRRALAQGVPASGVVRIIDHLTSTVLQEQGIKNRSQALLSSGAVAEAVTFKASMLRSAEESVRITGEVARIEPVRVDGPPVEGMLRDDLGRRNGESVAYRQGRDLNLHVGGRIGVRAGHFAEAIGRGIVGFGFGSDHIATSNRALGNHTVVTERADLTMYDAHLRLRVATETMGTFTVDVPAELALPTRDAPGLERDVFGHELTPPSEFNRIQQELAGLHGELNRIRQDFAPDRTVYDPHPLEPRTLAAGRGPGLGSAIRVHADTRLFTELRQAVEQALPDMPQNIRRQIVRDLELRFGGAALEADLTYALNGIRYERTIAGHTVEVAALGELGARHEVGAANQVLNERRITSWSGTSQREVSAGLRGEVAAVARVDIGRALSTGVPEGMLKVDVPNIAGILSGSKADAVAVTSGHTRYDRTEAGGGFTFTRDLSFDVSMRVSKDGEVVADTSWRVDGSRAEIAVPEPHLQETPLLAGDVAGVGRIEALSGPPHDVWAHDGRLHAIVRLGAMPDLARAVGEVYAAWADVPAPARRLDVPYTIENVVDVIGLETMITSHPDGLPHLVAEHGGWRHELHVRADVADMTYVKSETGVEHEAYANSNSRVMTGERGSRGVGGHARAGARLELGGDGEGGGEGGGAATGTEHKLLARAGAHAAAKSMSLETSYRGGSDVSRVTYNDGGTSHWYRGDLVLTVTPSRTDGRVVEQGEPVHLRVSDIMDIVLPDEVARRHTLDVPEPPARAAEESQASGLRAAEEPDPSGPDAARGPEKDAEGSEPARDVARAYVAPEAAMSTASVQHLDARGVLPAIVETLRGEGLLLPGQEFTTHPVAEHLRGHFGQDALATKLGDLRGNGVSSWLFVTDPAGRVTERVAVRVTAELGDGVHVGERPDTGLMLRSERLSGDLTLSERGTDRGAELLGHYIRTSDGDIVGGEAGTTTSRDTHHVDARGTNVKDINRFQTREAPQEFRHPVTYDITLERTKVSPVMEPVQGAARGLLLRAGELTGHDGAVRFFDRHVGVTTTTGAKAHGEVGLLVAGHLTTEVPHGTPVTARTEVVAAQPRWAEPGEPGPLTATLGHGVPRGDVNQVAFPAARLLEEWAPLATVAPRLRAEVPATADRPAGLELSHPGGIALNEATKERTMRAHIGSLLTHSYELPGVGTVGIEVTGVREIAEAQVKQRVYSQTMDTTGHGQAQGGGRAGRGGVSGNLGAPSPGHPGGEDGHGSGGEGGHHEGPPTVAYGGVGGGSKAREEAGSRNGDVLERNFVEKEHDNAYLECDISVVVRGKGTPLVLDVERGLYLRLTPEGLAALKNTHPAALEQ
ncbi:WXG100-like domain-containing protein [Nonomuraea maritima]|uniref:WXG100-like domain-containing protein n=1 Tax=Nonomuraea maritima TaxID=683260 RepID=UPI0037145D7A